MRSAGANHRNTHNSKKMTVDIGPGGPKGSKNMLTIIMEAARDQVSVTIDGKPRKISKAKRPQYNLRPTRATGNPKLLAQFLDWLDEIEARAEAARPSEYPLSAKPI